MTHERGGTQAGNHFLHSGPHVGDFPQVAGADKDVLTPTLNTRAVEIIPGFNVLEYFLGGNAEFHA